MSERKVRVLNRMKNKTTIKGTEVEEKGKQMNIERPTSNVEWKSVRWLLIVNHELMNLEPKAKRRQKTQSCFF